MGLAVIYLFTYLFCDFIKFSELIIFPPFVFCSVNNLITSVNAALNSISVLIGTNFKAWEENVQIILGCMDLDLAFRLDKHVALIVASSPTEKRDFERWIVPIG